MGFTEIQPALKAYLDRVKQHVTISKALVFGSVAEGTARSDSDVDLLILSEDFASLDEDDRAKLRYRASVGFPYDLHVYGFTPQEFADASSLTSLGAIRNLKKYSIVNVP